MVTISNEIIKSAAAGDKIAQSILYKKSKSYVFFKCLNYSKTKALAEDLTQDVFIKAFKYLPSFRNDTELSFTSWLNKVVMSVCVSNFNRDKKTNVLKSSVSYDDPEFILNEPSEDDIHVSAYDSFNKMKESSSKNVFFDYSFCGLSHAEIAENRKMNVQTVKTQYKRFKDKLIKHMYEEAY